MRSRIGLIIALGLLFAGSGSDAFADKRVALVIGNSAYKHAPSLANAENDTTAVGTMLRGAGFDVVEQRNLGNDDMRRAVRDFTDRTRDADIALVYFAGHGIEVSGSNFLVPVDAQLRRDIDVEDEAVALDRVVKMLEPAKRLRLVILDACRDNPLASSMRRQTATRSLGRGFAPVEPLTSDTLIVFAAKAGSTAADGQGVHSPFTRALLDHIVSPGLDIRFALGRVRDDVMKNTSGAQEPVVYGTLGGSVVALLPGAGVGMPSAAPAAPPANTGTDALRAYEFAVTARSKDVWDAFLLAHGTSRYAGAAREHRDGLLNVGTPAGPTPGARPAAAPTTSLAAVPPAASQNAPTPNPAPAARAPAALPKNAGQPAPQPQQQKKQPTQARQVRDGGGGGGGDSDDIRRMKAQCRSAVRAATAAGWDNGTGVIAAARSYCGG